MFVEFGHAPLCLELDIDSYHGPWQHVARFRRSSGWLMVSKCTIQSEHDILTARLIAACDEQENPIPSFQAKHLTECNWINPVHCDELPPDILDDLICEEEGALIARWHREKNSALAEAFEDQETRVAELEGRVQSTIDRNDSQIAELRQRRRHPDATPDMRRAMGQIIRELDEDNDELIAELSETRAAIREQSNEFEETLWAREDLLIEVAPIHIMRWKARSLSYSDIPARSKQYSTLFIPACGRTGGATPELESTVREFAAALAKIKAEKAAKDVIGVQHGGAVPKHSPAMRKITSPAAENSAEDASAHELGWTYKRVELLKSMWCDGQSASTIATALGNTSRNAVIGKAQRLGLPKSNSTAAMERLQPILAPVALCNLQLERDRAQRSLTALEVRGRKFFEGSKKFTRNREQRTELEEKIAELDQKIAKVAGRLKEQA